MNREKRLVMLSILRCLNVNKLIKSMIDIRFDAQYPYDSLIYPDSTTALIRRMSAVNLLTMLYVKIREFHKTLSKGQTMTEYALILAAVAVVVFVTYEVMGQQINNLVNFIDSDLSTAAS